MSWLRQIFCDWSGELSWLRVFGALVVVCAAFGLVYCVVTHWSEGIMALSALIGVIFAAKALQTKQEAAANDGTNPTA